MGARGRARPRVAPLSSVVALLASPLFVSLSPNGGGGGGGGGAEHDLFALTRLNIGDERAALWHALHDAEAPPTPASVGRGGGGATPASAAMVAGRGTPTQQSAAAAPAPQPAVPTLDVGFLTRKALRHALTSGCDALHLAAHGVERGGRPALALETSEGGAELLDADLLRLMLEAGGGLRQGGRGGPPRIRLVVLAACRSQWAAEFFHAAGVPHVVAVRTEVRDESCRTYLTAFYEALAAGQGVKDAHDTANTEVAAAAAAAGSGGIGGNGGGGDPSGPAAFPSPFTYSCSEGAPEGAGRGAAGGGGGDAAAAASPHTPGGAGGGAVPPPYAGMVDAGGPTFQSLLGTLPPLADHFIGRELIQHDVLQSLKSRRAVTLHGAQGVGKTAVAVAVATWVALRRQFPDGVIYVDVRAAIDGALARGGFGDRGSVSTRQAVVDAVARAVWPTSAATAAASPLAAAAGGWDVGEAAGAVQAFLLHRHALLVLDGVDGVDNDGGAGGVGGGGGGAGVRDSIGGGCGGGGGVDDEAGVEDGAAVPPASLITGDAAASPAGRDVSGLGSPHFDSAPAARRSRAVAGGSGGDDRTPLSPAPHAALAAFEPFTPAVPTPVAAAVPASLVLPPEAAALAPSLHAPPLQTTLSSLDAIVGTIGGPPFGVLPPGEWPHGEGPFDPSLPHGEPYVLLPEAPPGDADGAPPPYAMLLPMADILPDAVPPPFADDGPDYDDGGGHLRLPPVRDPPAAVAAAGTAAEDPAGPHAPPPPFGLAPIHVRRHARSSDADAGAAAAAAATAGVLAAAAPVPHPRPRRRRARGGSDDADDPRDDPGDGAATRAWLRDFVASLVTRTHALRVLVTARAPLAFPSEEALPVPPLSLADAAWLFGVTLGHVAIARDGWTRERAAGPAAAVGCVPSRVIAAAIAHRGAAGDGGTTAAATPTDA